LLRRVRDTPPQGAPTTRSRRRNVEGAFALRPAGWAGRPPRLDGRSVLLVDDVMTSGATLSACARVRRRAGARRAFALTAARGGIPGEGVAPSGGAPRASGRAPPRGFPG